MRMPDPLGHLLCARRERGRSLDARAAGERGKPGFEREGSRDAVGFARVERDD